MNEQRLVTLILIILLVLGAAGIVAFYLTTYGRMKILPGPASPVRTEADTTNEIAKKSLSPSGPVSRGAVLVLADKSANEIAAATKSKDISPGQSSTNPTGTELKEKAPPKEVPSTQVPGSGDAVVVKDQPRKESETAPAKLPTITIHETSKSNGSFNTAQEITEGIITGKRGAAGDRSDFYKIRATGKTMILRLEPALRKKNQRFAMTVFDANKKPVGQDSRKTGPTIALDVKPEATYYIKLDLRHAPVKKPKYKLNVKFE
ncbi:MAG: hypothetical protein JRJ86_02000 [Deltaproteobacteria bacterium]|nr:hypothetical protein [Deltaproteobacteria bacterium]MBW2117898.1 hypothetical protein [Deltaproteobacteria bacterium]MBW2342829.1 hypothetical protein [Deltaproteobacteria bacterium]